MFFASVLGGLGWGLAATVLSGVLVGWACYLPGFPGAAEYSPGLGSIATFLVMGALFSWFHDRLRKARREAEEALERIRGLEEFKSQFLVSMLNQSNQDKTRYLGLFEHMTAGFAHCSLVCEGGEPVDVLILEVNPAFARILGLEGVAGRRLSAVVPGGPSARPELFQACIRVARTGVTGRLKVFSERLGTELSFNLYSPASGEFVALFEPIRGQPGVDPLENSNIPPILGD
jgi:PAS domain-containing protein